MLAGAADELRGGPRIKAISAGGSAFHEVGMAIAETMCMHHAFGIATP
jgi:hypothetical protein